MSQATTLRNACTHTTYFQTHSHVAHTQSHSHMAHTHRHTHMWHTLTHSLSHCQKCLAECLDARRDSIQVDLTCLQCVADARRPQLACCLPACSLRAARAACIACLPACTALLCVHFRFLTPPYTLQQQLHLQLPLAFCFPPCWLLCHI